MKNKIVLLVAIILITVFSAVVYYALPNVLVRISTVSIVYDNQGKKEFVDISPDYYTRTLSVSYQGVDGGNKSSGTIGSDFFDKIESILKVVRDKGDIGKCKGDESYRMTIGYSRKNWGVQSVLICSDNDKFPVLKGFYKDIVNLFSHDVY